MKNIIRFIIVGFLIVTALTRAADVAVIDIVSRAKSMPDGSRTVNVPSSVMTAIDKQTGNKYGQGVDFVNDGIETASRAARAASSASYSASTSDSTSSSSGSSALWDCEFLCGKDSFRTVVQASDNSSAQDETIKYGKKNCWNLNHQLFESMWGRVAACKKR